MTTMTTERTIQERMMLAPKCDHWDDCGRNGGGCCSIGLFDGKPSVGTCIFQCASYSGDHATRLEQATSLVNRAGREYAPAKIEQMLPGGSEAGEPKPIRKKGLCPKCGGEHQSIDPYQEIEKHCGVLWHGSPWPLRLRMKLRTPGDGWKQPSVWFARRIPFLWERVDAGCGCLAVLRAALQSILTATRNVRDLYKGSLEADAHDEKLAKEGTDARN